MSNSRIDIMNMHFGLCLSVCLYETGRQAENEEERDSQTETGRRNGADRHTDSQGEGQGIGLKQGRGPSQPGMIPVVTKPN